MARILFRTLALIGLASLATAQTPTIGSCTVLPADDIWNARIDQLPVSPNSATWVTTIGATSPLHPDFGSGTYQGEPIGIPFVTVPGTQTKYPATFTYQSESDPGPYAVPLTAPIEGGSSSTGDRHVIAVDTGNCILYEIYDAFPQTASWQGGSGAIFNLLSDALRPSTWTSADAAGLPIFPGLVRYDEIAAGAINHAIRFTVPRTQNTFVWPARHQASSLTGSQYPPMGARFRLKSSFNISTFSPTNQIILLALQRYGMMLADNGSSWYISGAPDSRWNNDDLHSLTGITGSNFEAVDVSPMMLDPNSGETTQTTVSVSVTPASASVQADAQKQFAATVSGNSNQSVTWDVNGTVGGNSTVGFVDSIGGLYTAPAGVPSPATVTVHATSKAVASAIGSASVTITSPPAPPVSVSLNPSSASVQAGTQKQFSATVVNNSNQSVTWDVNGIAGGNSSVGTVSSSGLYTAPSSVPSPATVTVHATSQAVTSAAGSASVTITSPPLPVSVSVNPSSASVQTGPQKQFTATVANNSNQSVTWDVNGIAGGNSSVGTISTSGMYTAPASVPSAATVTVHATSQGVTSAIGSASVTITNPPAVSVTVSPQASTVRAGRSQQFKATVQHASATTVDWQVNGIPGGNSIIGAISSSGLYTAPNMVPSPANVTVIAVSTVDPTKSATAAVTIDPKPRR